MVTVVACLLLLLNEELSAENVIEKVKTLRGNNAVQSIKVRVTVEAPLRKSETILLSS